MTYIYEPKSAFSDRSFLPFQNMFQNIIFLYFLLILIFSFSFAQNTNIYSWRPRPNYRQPINRYDENYYFLRPHSEQVRMNWPEYHIRNAYDRDYIPPDFTRTAYDRNYGDINSNNGYGYDNFLTINMRDRDNFYPRNPPRTSYYQNYQNSQTYGNMRVNFE